MRRSSRVLAVGLVLAACTVIGGCLDGIVSPSFDPAYFGGVGPPPRGSLRAVPELDPILDGESGDDFFDPFR